MLKILSTLFSQAWFRAEQAEDTNVYARRILIKGTQGTNNLILYTSLEAHNYIFSSSNLCQRLRTFLIEALPFFVSSGRLIKNSSRTVSQSGGHYKHVWR